jgi:hypothetical protein
MKAIDFGHQAQVFEAMVGTIEAAARDEIDPRQSQIVITVTPDTRPGRYRVYLETEQKPLCVSRLPFLAGARKLIARGHDPRTMLVMRWAGSKDWALRGALGAAAKLTVDDHNGTVFARWKPLCSAGALSIAKSADKGVFRMPPTVPHPSTEPAQSRSRQRPAKSGR